MNWTEFVCPLETAPSPKIHSFILHFYRIFHLYRKWNFHFSVFPSYTHTRMVVCVFSRVYKFSSFIAAATNRIRFDFLLLCFRFFCGHTQTHTHTQAECKRLHNPLIHEFVHFIYNSQLVQAFDCICTQVSRATAECDRDRKHSHLFDLFDKQ